MALKDLQAVARNETGIAAVLGILKQQLGERFQTGQSLREQHAHTTTYIPIQAPDGVAFPETTAEVQTIVRACAEHRVPVIAFGTGTSLEGHVNAPGGGISVGSCRSHPCRKQDEKAKAKGISTGSRPIACATLTS